MTQTPVTVTLSLPYDPDAIEIRRSAAPQARWIGSSRMWEMTAEDAEAWAAAMDASVVDLADYVERRRAGGHVSLRLRSDADRVRRARAYAQSIREQLAAASAQVGPSARGLMCCCGLRARDACSCES